MENFAEQAVGMKPPRSFLLDASVLDAQESHEILREDVKQNRIIYEFPGGFNKLDLFEECRALTMLDEFETKYDLTMQMLVGTDVIIQIRTYDRSLSELCAFHVVDRFKNPREGSKKLLSPSD